jgi:hypothetical protein
MGKETMFAHRPADFSPATHAARASTSVAPLAVINAARSGSPPAPVALHAALLATARATGRFKENGRDMAQNREELTTSDMVGLVAPARVILTVSMSPTFSKTRSKAEVAVPVSPLEKVTQELPAR